MCLESAGRHAMPLHGIGVLCSTAHKNIVVAELILIKLQQPVATIQKADLRDFI